MELIKIEICRLASATLNKIVLDWNKITVTFCTTKHIVIIIDDVIYNSDNLQYVDELFYLTMAYYVINNIPGLPIPSNRNSQLHIIKQLFGTNISISRHQVPRHVTFTVCSESLPTLTLSYIDQNPVTVNYVTLDIIRAVIQCKLFTNHIEDIFPNICCI